MKILNKVLIFLEKKVPFFSVPKKKVFDKGSHELEFFQNKRRFIDIIQSCCDNVKDSLNCIPYVISLCIRLRKQ